MAQSDRPNESLTEDEIASFEDAVGDLGDRVVDSLAEATDRTHEEVEDAVDEYPMPEDIEFRPLED